MLMNAGIEDVASVFEEMLRTVAVMDIEIEDRYALGIIRAA